MNIKELRATLLAEKKRRWTSIHEEKTNIRHIFRCEGEIQLNIVEPLHHTVLDGS